MASMSRQNVASGGIYDLPKVSYSESTRVLLKELLQEAAVNLQHQRHIERWVGSGRTLPRQDALTVPSQTTPRHSRPSSSASRTTQGPHMQTKRSHEVMKKMGLYEPNTHYVPPPPKYGVGAKERCQELMAYGREGVNMRPSPRQGLQGKQAESPEPDRFAELVGEMEERVQWLEAMEAVGAGDKYRSLITTQLALKLRDLELIDQERARDLARVMRQKTSSSIKNVQIQNTTQKS